MSPRWIYTGVKSGEKKDLQERLNLRAGREYSDYVKNTSVDIIKEMNLVLSAIDPDTIVAVVAQNTKLNTKLDQSKFA